MKRLMRLVVLLAALGIGVGQSVAEVQPPKVPPKGTEGPDIRAKVAARGVKGTDILRTSSPPFTRPEGPDVR